MLVITLLALSLGGCVACRVFHSGPYRVPEPLPEAKLLDIHVHTAGIGAGDSGCFISKQMESSWKLGIYLKSFGTTREALQAKGDAHVVHLISRQLAGSKHVGQAILLAMDGVVDANGELDRARTEIYVPNEFIAKETAKTTNLLFGASINPLRKDALTQLDWAKVNGARLVKWIPSIMQFDPADERLTPFYRKLVELKLPLLTHAGQERSFTSARDELCDPQRLHLPLKLGVTVIVAHIASTGANAGQRDTDRLAPMMATYTNLFSEISSLTQVNKLGYLKEALTRPEWQGRLLFGSDYPLINTALCSPYCYPLNLTAEQCRRLSAIENPWDRDVELKQALGVPRGVFERSANLLR
ncbi:MAG: amidohydrolase family protein [Verrucomicrobia bacterium]|nr:amidohydrolase family protein [Verrucomicrobiota bacterium]